MYRTNFYGHALSSPFAVSPFLPRSQTMLVPSPRADSFSPLAKTNFEEKLHDHVVTLAETEKTLQQIKPQGVLQQRQLKLRWVSLENQKKLLDLIVQHMQKITDTIIANFRQ